MNLTIIRSNRKTITMRITGPDSVEVRAPLGMPQSQIDDFIDSGVDVIFTTGGTGLTQRDITIIRNNIIF